MVAMEAGEVKQARESSPRFLLYWSRMQSRIKPYAEQAAEQARRAEQHRVFRRNQAFGLLLLAAIVCTWWLFHTNPRWIFPPGWWRP